MLRDKINIFKNYELIKNLNIFIINSKKYFKFVSYHEVPGEILESKTKYEK